ncbi:MAG: hypothetical protein AAF626_02645 [Pseudomonadota bacterium]
MELMRACRNSGIHTSVIFILRSPFEAFLSQVQASKEVWPDKRLTEVSESNFQMFARSSIASLALFVRDAGAHKLRFTSYDRLCEATDVELARVMAVFPLRMEAAQLNLATASHVGGDPSANRKKEVSHSSRRVEAQNFKAQLSPSPEKAKFVHIEQLAAHYEDLTTREVLDELTRIVILGQGARPWA